MGSCLRDNYYKFGDSHEKEQTLFTRAKDSEVNDLFSQRSAKSSKSPTKLKRGDSVNTKGIRKLDYSILKSKGPSDKHKLL